MRDEHHCPDCHCRMHRWADGFDRNGEFRKLQCRPCWLELLTTQDVRWLDEEERDYAAEGESLAHVEFMLAAEAWAPRPDEANATDGTAIQPWMPHFSVHTCPRNKVDHGDYQLWIFVASACRGDDEPEDSRANADRHKAMCCARPTDDPHAVPLLDP